jgi:hypothetical protein
VATEIAGLEAMPAVNWDEFTPVDNTEPKKPVDWPQFKPVEASGKASVGDAVAALSGGVGIYRFRNRAPLRAKAGAGWPIGVITHEAARVPPDAVGVDGDFTVVDYGQL